MIRALTPKTDHAQVTAFYMHNADYFLMAEGQAPTPAMAAAFFTDVPPSCDPARSCHFGLFSDDALAGIADISFGFPEETDAYLGLMLLDTAMRGKGHGVGLLAHACAMAGSSGAQNLYLAVRDSNPRARAFWHREGFCATGLSGTDDRGNILHRLVKPL